MLSRKKLLSLFLVVGLLSPHLSLPSQARRTTQLLRSPRTTDKACVIRIINALITSTNNFILDFGLGLTVCGFTSCAFVPALGMVFVADCLACIGSAIPFIGLIPETVCM